jgi:GT2 family glycosyltransferase
LTNTQLTAELPVVSVIVITWDTCELTLACLASVRRSSPGISTEFIIVDNGSTDGTPDIVQREYPDAVVIRNTTNAGFPRANNQGLRHARGKYVLFLNSDTVVGPGAIEACVAELEADANVGMVGCRLVYADGRTQFEAARNPYMLRDLLSEVFYLHMLFPRSGVFAHHLIGDWDHLDRRDVEAISGAFMLVRREIADAVGGLPEDLLAYHEDLAFCLRVRRRGWRVRYLGDVVTVHIANQGTSRHKLRWYLLECECKLRLIREGQGRLHAAVARVVFPLQFGLRLTLALIAAVVPGTERARKRYPKVFHVERQAVQLAWSITPRLVRGLIPGAAQNMTRTRVRRAS